MSHTPGPWHIVENTQFVSDSHHMTICRVNDTVSFGLHGKSRSDGARSGDANGRLIAAAPDLLEVCLAYASAYEEIFVNPSEMPEESRDIYDLAKAAIAKAKGTR